MTQGQTVRACRYFYKVSAGIFFFFFWAETSVSSIVHRNASSITASRKKKKAERRSRRNEIWRGWDVGINLNKKYFFLHNFFRLPMKFMRGTESTNVRTGASKRPKCIQWMRWCRWWDESGKRITGDLKWSPRRSRRRKKELTKTKEEININTKTRNYCRYLHPHVFFLVICKWYEDIIHT